MDTDQNSLNPYQAPATESRSQRDDREARLSSIARCQKGVLICVTLQLVLIAVQVLFGPRGGWWQLLAMTMLAVMCMGAVFVFLLSKQINGIAMATFQALLAFPPCLGILVMLNVSIKAAQVLRGDGLNAGRFPDDT